MTGPPARLEVVAGKAAGMSILIEDELVVGRHAQGAGRLADDEEISRAHARFALDQNGFIAIDDLGSTNGTFVNGLRISTPHTLSEGDTIELGATTLVVRELPSRQAMPEAEPRAPQPTVQTSIPQSPVPEMPAPAEEEPLAGPPATEEVSTAPAEPEPLADLPATEEVSTAPAEPEPEPPADPAVIEDVSTAPAAKDAAVAALALQIEVDFEAREARISTDYASETIRLVFQGGGWHPAPANRIEEESDA